MFATFHFVFTENMGQDWKIRTQKKYIASYKFNHEIQSIHQMKANRTIFNFNKILQTKNSSFCTGFVVNMIVGLGNGLLCIEQVESDPVLGTVLDWGSYIERDLTIPRSGSLSTLFERPFHNEKFVPPPVYTSGASRYNWYSCDVDATFRTNQIVMGCQMSEWIIIFNGLSGDSGQWGPYSRYKPVAPFTNMD